MAAFLTGCFQVETTVRVNPDGSGRVEERMLLSDKVISQIDEMSKAFAGPEGKPEKFNLHDVKALRKRAGEMGEGVTFVSSKAIAVGGYSGYRAVYAFKDINKLRLGREGAKSMAGQGGTSAGSEEQPFMFSFTPGKKARLVVIPPHKEKASGKPEPAVERKATEEGEKPPMTPEQEKQVAEMMKGMRFSLALEVNGTVLESNATHRDGGRITVFEFDLDKMGADPARFDLLKKAEPADFAEAKEILKGLPGFKADLNDRLEVVFAR
jgi:hypothetical protein